MTNGVLVAYFQIKKKTLKPRGEFATCVQKTSVIKAPHLSPGPCCCQNGELAAHAMDNVLYLPL